MKKFKQIKLKETLEIGKEEINTIVGGIDYDSNVLYRAVATRYERQEFRRCESHSYEGIIAWADCWRLLGWNVYIERIDLGEGDPYPTKPYYKAMHKHKCIRFIFQ